MNGGADIRKMKRPPTHPGEVLAKEFLTAYGAQGRAADAMGMSRNRLNEIVVGKRPVTPASAVLIGAYTRTNPIVWLRLQANWDLWYALQDVDTSKIVPL